MYSRVLSCLAFAVLGAGALSAADEPKPAFAVNIQVDAAKPVGEMKPIWKFFGADEPNYAYMKDGKKLLGELGQLRSDDMYFRAHNLLNTGDGTPAYKWGSTNIYTEDAQGRPVYDWTIVDRIFDTYRARGFHPYAQLGFMPEAMTTGPQPYQHAWRPGTGTGNIDAGWAYPPKDYAKWEELAYQWAKHCLERYGQAEVDKWYWEIWNEPNGASYWHSTVEEFCKLHDYAIAGIRRALPNARVGGPDVAGAGGKFMQDFLAHVARGKNYVTGQAGTPTDFVSFHAKGSPAFVDGHVRLGIANQLRTTDEGFALIAAVPELKNKPIVIGESDPDGCAACQAPQLGYRTTTMFSSYEAAVFARQFQLADRRGVNLEGALTWSFEFEDQPFFAGQRTMATGGIDLPVLNVFRMFSKMGGQRVATQSSGEIALDAIMRQGVRGAPDVAALASLEAHRLSIMVWHYHDDDVPGPDAAVELALAHLPAGVTNARVSHYRIDATHSNSFTVWKSFGAPTSPNRAQYEQMEKAGQLAQLEEPAAVNVADGAATLKFTLPRQAVSLLVLEW
ncbi:MAG TPA: beta-xylosidase [Opitutaceae bacterium]|nr:beta-xylosidase [Opitutaceae bacterium]